MERQMRREDGFIGVRCPKEVAERLRRRARQRGWTISKFVLEALDAAFAAEDRASE
jgi:hypothetical protein